MNSRRFLEDVPFSDVDGAICVFVVLQVSAINAQNSGHDAIAQRICDRFGRMF